MLRKSQQGISFGGVMLLAPLVGVFVLILIKLIPVYMENGAVKSVLSGMSAEVNENYSSPSMVRGTIMKRLGVNNIDRIQGDDIVIEREGPFFSVMVEYDVQIPLFYNLSLVASFSNKGQVPAT